ncbi:MAG TPA: DUF6069 family protein [Segeticoccus sp.]|nr:DUF6069 family protein [Segeticoccus sp.]
MYVAHRTRVRALTLVAAPAAAVGTWALLQAGGIELVTDAGRTVGAISVVVVASLVALAGWGVVAVLERRTGRPALWWGLVASAALSLSILGPGAAATDAGVLLGLVLLHVVTAAVVMGGLSASLGRRPAVRGC